MSVFSTAASISSCFYSRAAVASALRSLWAGFNLCFLLWALCSHVNTRVQGYVLVHGFILSTGNYVTMSFRSIYGLARK